MIARKKYILVVNPIAGGVDKSEIVAKVESFADNLQIDVVLYETTGVDDQQQIQQLYQQHLPERILIVGGDGTIKSVAEALEKDAVVFGILPAGSANGLSTDLNFPPTLEENLQIAFSDNIMDLDMLCINNIKSLHLSDIGLNAELIKNYENGSIRGKLGYALQAINTLTDDEAPFTATIVANGKKNETEAKMIVFANSQKYGTGVTINPEGKMNDGKFEIVILKNLDLIVFGKIITGNMPINSIDVEIIAAEEATITTNNPVHFQVDGEYYGEVSTIDVRIFKQHLKVAVPLP